MPLLDRISDIFARIGPSRPSKSQAMMSGGIGGGAHGMVPFHDDILAIPYVVPTEWPSTIVSYLRNHVVLSVARCMTGATSGELILLLFIPVLWVPWIWMIVSKPAIVFHTSQIFFNFLAMACFASVASFQAKWGVGPSGLSGFAIFISVAGIFLSAFMLMVPVLYEKYDKLVRLARALREVRVGFILTGAGTAASLLIAFIVTISAWTQPGCKNAENDPHAKDKGKDFQKGLDGWCSTKKAGAIFFWLAFGFWLSSFILLILDWRSGKLHAPRDPPFTPPQPLPDEEADDNDNTSYSHIPPARQSSTSSAVPPRFDNSNTSSSPFSDANRYSAASAFSPSYATSTSTAAPVAARPSLDAYGAFSDPAPSGFGGYGNSSPARSTPSSGAPVLPDVDTGPRVSRTMQYADPYAAVRASIAASAHQSPSVPPSYESFQEYR